MTVGYAFTDTASPALIGAMLADIGIQDEEVAAATRAWCDQLVSDMPDMDMGRLQPYAANFANGYVQGRAAHRRGWTRRAQ